MNNIYLGDWRLEPDEEDEHEHDDDFEEPDEYPVDSDDIRFAEYRGYGED